jgi:hypothetical protein
MEPEAKYTLVGGSVLALLALLIAAVAWLASASRGTDVQRYTIYFQRQSLEGLQVRSDVRMKGIRVGAVTGFSFAPQRPGTVEVVIGIDPATPVKESTRAIVDRNLITGLATIRLQNRRRTACRWASAAGQRDPDAEGACSRSSSETANELAQPTRRCADQHDAVEREPGGAGRDAANLRAVAQCPGCRGAGGRGAGVVAHCRPVWCRHGPKPRRRPRRPLRRARRRGQHTPRDASVAMRQAVATSRSCRATPRAARRANAEVRLTSQQLRGTAEAVAWRRASSATRATSSARR